MNDAPAPETTETDKSRFRSRKERVDSGKKLRAELPRKIHAEWKAPDNRRDPIDVLEESNHLRIEDLIPIRYGRMLKSPFTFYRGSAPLMAYDLSALPNIGLNVQACGDCHLLNFGFFATPERNLVFDINDFDETHPAPWEWDVKRLVTSVVIAGRDQGLSDEESRSAAVACASAYRENVRTYSKMSPLEVWYANLDIEAIIEMAPDGEVRKRRELLAEKARQRTTEFLFPKIVNQTGGRYRFADQPPALYHSSESDAEHRVRDALEDYRQTLPDERRVLFDRYQLVDFAVKAVGIGSVGTRCGVFLMFSEENHPLILQFKEARASVLEPYTQKSRYDNQGQRVVVGQRLMQSSSDIFLGWCRSRLGYDFYLRQLRDMKMSVPMEGLLPSQLTSYSQFCGWTLARTHAKSGDSATISGYLGKGDQFDEAMGSFAIAYADQTERDYEQFVKAVRTDRIRVLIEDDV